MSSTLAQLRSKLRTEIKIDPNGKIWNDSTLNSYINRAYLQIQQDWNLDWQENDANTTYTPTAQETTLPTDFWKVILIRYNWTELFPTTKAELKRQYTSFQSGTPYKYYLFSNKLWTDTIPSWWTIDLDYKKINASLSADSDTSAYPLNFDTAIVKYSAYLAWSATRGNAQTATEKLQEYKNEVKTLSWSYVYNDANTLRFWTQRSWQVWLRSDVLYR